MTPTYRVRAYLEYGQVRYKIQRLWLGLFWLDMDKGYCFSGFLSPQAANEAAAKLRETNGGELL